MAKENPSERMAQAKDRIGRILAGERPHLPAGMSDIQVASGGGSGEDLRLAIVYMLFMLTLAKSEKRIASAIDQIVKLAKLRSHALRELPVVKHFMPGKPSAVIHRYAKVLHLASKEGMSPGQLYKELGEARGLNGFINERLDEKTKRYRQEKIDLRVSEIQDKLMERDTSTVETSSGKASEVKKGSWVVAIGRKRNKTAGRIHYYHLEMIDNAKFLKLVALFPKLRE